MKVKFIRRNAVGLGLNSDSLAVYDSMYGGGNVDNHKDYGSKGRIPIGCESTVYAIANRAWCTLLYIKEPRDNYISHYPAICFDIIDSRISRYWHIKRSFIPEGPGFFPRAPFEHTVMAIEEWVKEPRFLEFYVEGQKREVSIMNKMAKLMDDEFD